MTFKAITTAAAVILLLTACADKESEAGVIPEGYKSALEKAQGVESQLQDTLQIQREKMDAGEQ